MAMPPSPTGRLTGKFDLLSAVEKHVLKKHSMTTEPQLSLYDLAGLEDYSRSDALLSADYSQLEARVISQMTSSPISANDLALPFRPRVELPPKVTAGPPGRPQRNKAKAKQQRQARKKNKK